LDVAAPGIFANDTKADSHDWFLMNVTQPMHGAVNVSPTGAFIYSPATNYYGPDAFTYQASDGIFNVAATVNLTVTPVNDAPIAGPDSLQTTVNTPVSVSVATLLANDTDPEGDALSFAGYSSPSAHGGTLSLQNGIMTYTPPLDFFGTDTFHYTVSDSYGYGSEGYVTVTIPDPEFLRVHINPTPTGYHLKLLGLPGHSYAFQYSDEPTGPWTDLKQVDAPASGIVETDDASDPQVIHRFYRVMEP
jgi:hypothetical protein